MSTLNWLPLVSLILMGLAPLASAQEAPSSPVAVATVENTLVVPTVPVTGSVYSRNEMQITSGVDGQLEFVAEPGTLLSKGEVIARIHTLPLELQKAEQQAQLSRATAQLRFLNAQLERQKGLLSTNSTSANQHEQTESDRDVAASDLRIAELRIRQLDDQLRRATIRANFDGVVVERLRREGEDVSRGTVLARVTDTENLEVRVLAPLRYQGAVRPGDSLGVFGYQSQFVANLRSIVPSADRRSQTFELRLDLPARGDWAIGQLVSVAIPVHSGSASLVVPRDAVVLRQDGTYVFRIDAQNRAQRIAVQIGEGAGDRVAVTGELRAGDRVVVRGAETLNEGQSVAIVAEGGGSSADAVASP